MSTAKSTGIEPTNVLILSLTNPFQCVLRQHPINTLIHTAVTAQDAYLKRFALSTNEGNLTI